MNNTLQQKLNAHFEIIKKLDTDNNLVIGGTVALVTHGLKMSRNCEDLDVIIYEPTLQQNQVLSVLKMFDTITDRPGEYGSDIEHMKAIKIVNDGSILNILIERKPLPTNVLFYEYKPGQMFRIQNIETVLEAKLSYKTDVHVVGGGLKKYSRTKDIEDMIDLKNSNFNLLK